VPSAGSPTTALTSAFASNALLSSLPVVFSNEMRSAQAQSELTAKRTAVNLMAALYAKDSALVTAHAFAAMG